LSQAHYNSVTYGNYDGVHGLLGFKIDNEYERDALWYLVKENIIPRLKGKLGTTLLELNYTGDTLYLGRNLTGLCCGFTNSASTVSNLYLTLSENTGATPPPPIHYYTGFFSRPGDPLDNYFMLVNLITTLERNIFVAIEPPVSGYQNYRFRDIEGLFDTTFNDGIETLLTYPPGEAYLYQVAPVVLYGGRLLY